MEVPLLLIFMFIFYAHYVHQGFFVEQQKYFEEGKLRCTKQIVEEVIELVRKHYLDQIQ